MKKLKVTLYLFFLFTSISSFGQQKVITLSAPISGTQVYEARDQVLIQPGFSYAPAGSQTFNARINENLIVNVDYQTAVDPSTRTLNTDLPVGTSLGKAGVSSSGAASFNLPITVSPGTAGMQPNLSVNYYSNRVNGLLGFGWNIDGFSSITRLPKNLHYDDQINEIELSSNDRFGLNGNRLLVTNGNAYGGDGTTYSTASESFVKITSYGASGSGPRWFKMETKNGITVEFGNSSNSFLQAQNKEEILFWYISKIYDKKGNYMTFTYHSDRAMGEFWPERIDYTGNTNTGLTPYNSVNFVYESRSNDVLTSFVAGTTIVQNKLLSKIKVKNGTSTIREYELKYSFTDKSMLNEFIEHGSSGNAFNSYVFSYHNYENAQGLANYTSLLINQNIFADDFNGDGKDELILNGCIYSLNSGNDFTKNGGSVIPLGKIKTGDFDADGKADVVLPLANNTSGFAFYSSTGLNFTFVANRGKGSTGTPDLYAYDFDGDGDVDIFNRNPANNTYNISWGSWTAPLVGNADISLIWGSKQYWGDFNGNGKIELMTLDASGYRIYEWVNNNFTQRTSGSTPNSSHAVFAGDYNGDGRMDFLWGNLPRTGLRHFTNIKSNISNGNSFIVTDFGTDIFDDTTIGFMDYTSYDMDGDGQDEFIGFDPAEHIFYTYKYKNSQYINVPSLDEIDGPILTVKDFNGDGITDCLCQSILGNKIRIVSVGVGNQKDLLSTVTNGMNHKIQFTYKPTTNSSVYSNPANCFYPLVPLTKPIYVVASVKSDNDPYAQTEVSYTYEGGFSYKIDNSFIGFSKITSQDLSRGTKTISYNSVNQTYLFLEPFKKEEYADNKLISESVYTSDIKTFGNKRIFPYIKQTVSKYYELNTSTLYNTITNTATYDDYGNLTQQKTNYNGIATSTIDNVYGNYDSYCLNRLTRTTLTKTRGSEPVFTSITSFDYQAQGYLTRKTIEPGNVKQLFTDYRYDDYGNINNIKVTPDGINGRVSIMTYDTKGRFLKKQENIRGHYVEYTYDEGLGVVTQQKDHNNLTTRFVYDEFGRLIETKQPDGNSSKLTLGWVTGTSPNNARYYIKSEIPGSPEAYQYYDKFGRAIQRNRPSLDGRRVITDTKYNSLGQVEYTTLPYFSGESDSDRKTNTYDKLGRIKTEVAPGVDLVYSYDGLQTTVTNNISGQTSTQIADASGNLAKSSDRGGEINYTYYSSGLTKSVITPVKTIEMNYDQFGNQTLLRDPDAGEYTYSYNVYGELHTQTDPNSRTTTLNYDDLGRLESQTGGSFDISYTYKGNGQLDNISSTNGITYTYGYDELGRSNSKTASISGLTLTTSLNYNTIGQVSQVSYPSGFMVNYNYQNGYLKDIRRNDSGKTIWSLGAVNSKDQLTQVVYGNNISGSRGYESRGYLQTIQTGVGNNIQNLEYHYNSKGLMDWRKDNRRSLVENFGYDDYNRLNSVQIGTSASRAITYLPNGSIDTKYDVGSYVYDATHPTAVAQVSNTYNLISQEQQNITYTSFDKVASITEGSNNATFTYGPDLNRKFVESNIGGVNIKKYYSGLFEREIKNSVTRDLHYIMAYGETVAIYEATGGNGQMHYVHNDHLGSLNVFTNESGTIEQELSFDAWGNRRNPATLQNLTNAPSGLITDRGFTGHEHMDAFKLINMNGRVYDPLLARFLSPDNYVQANNTQNYNSYSYCLNNPLSFVDPSGMIYMYKEMPVGLGPGDRISFSFGGGGGGSPVLNWDRDYTYNWITGGYEDPYSGSTLPKDQINNYLYSKRNGPILSGKDALRVAQQITKGFDLYSVSAYKRTTYVLVPGGQNYGIDHFTNRLEGYSTSNVLDVGGTTIRDLVINDVDGEYTVAQRGGSLSKWLSNFWNNSTVMKIIPDVIYINTSLSFNPGKGPGSGTIGYALPIKGKQAFHLFAYSSNSEQYGLHAGIGINVGYSSYVGDSRNFDMYQSFAGNSIGAEGDILLGCGYSASGADKAGAILYSYDVGFGPSFGSSSNFSTTSIFQIW